MYDNEDSVCGIIYNSTPYYFLKNQQGDIIAITNRNGGTIARYSYDAWGVCTILQDTTVVGIAAINPFRYRGYYYDAEIGMYYLQSRYYNPSVGRFVNADEAMFASINRCNLLSYCSNNPIMNSDSSGNIAIAIVLGGMMITLALIMSITGVIYLFNPSYRNQLNKSISFILTNSMASIKKLQNYLDINYWAAALSFKLATMIVNAQIKAAAKKIPNKLKTKDGKVDLSKFNIKLPNNGGWKGPDGWRIVKDTAKHAGSVWKLLNKAGDRIATLWEDGRIRGK